MVTRLGSRSTNETTLFVGRILGLRRIISFHGETEEELRQEFAAAVQDYLRDCKEQGLQ